MSYGIVSIPAAPRLRYPFSSAHDYRVSADTRLSQGITPKLCISDAARFVTPAVSPERNDAMSNTNCSRGNCLIRQRLATIQLSDSDRQRAAFALGNAEAIADAVIWVKEGIASLGAMLPRLGFKH
jgi:hypothetical protein